MANDNDLLGKKSRARGKSKDLQLQLHAVNSVTKSYSAAKNLPQAVLKVSSYGHGSSKVGAHVNYINRNGELEVEDPAGNKIQDPAELKKLMNEWASDFDKRKNSRDTVNIVLSAPIGSSRPAVEKSVREFAKETFGDSNDYLFAMHDDTEHPHGHLVVKMRGYDGEKLDPRKEDLKLWRETFAKKMRSNGIEVDASPRFERGQGRKSTKQAIVNIRKRGETPTVDKQALNEITKEIKDGVSQKGKEWAVKSKKKTHEHKKSLHESAKIVSELAEDGTMKKMAEEVKAYAKRIPEPKTRAEEIEHAALNRNKNNDIER